LREQGDRRHQRAKVNDELWPAKIGLTVGLSDGQCDIPTQRNARNFVHHEMAAETRKYLQT